jgi:hypothetical protein
MLFCGKNLPQGARSTLHHFGGRQLTLNVSALKKKKLTCGITLVILLHMKTAISIPDKLFRAADQYAKNHGFSRSRLYSEAVAQFLEQHSSELITKQLNEIYSSEPAKLNETLSTMQFSSIEKEEW